MKFHDIVVLIWDFDGTLYKPNPELFAVVREAEYQTIMHHTGWKRDKAIEEFTKLHKIVYPSATETVARITGMTTTQAALKMENYYDWRPFLRRDKRLMKTFQALKRFRHFILANGVRDRIEKCLDLLGLPRKIFEQIVTSEIVSVNKPHPDGFRYILNKTGLPPIQHLMIGDRLKVDLEPAKKLGMKTCLVWSEKQDPSADAVLPIVYDLPSVLL